MRPCEWRQWWWPDSQLLGTVCALPFECERYMQAQESWCVSASVKRLLQYCGPFRAVTVWAMTRLALQIALWVPSECVCLSSHETTCVWQGDHVSPRGIFLSVIFVLLSLLVVVVGVGGGGGGGGGAFDCLEVTELVTKG